MMNWIQREETWLQDMEYFQRGIDERRKWDEWERNKERAAETPESESEEA